MIKFSKVLNIEREEYIVYATKQNGVEGEDICIGYIIKNPIMNIYCLQASKDSHIIYSDNSLVSIAKFIKKLNKDLKKKNKIRRKINKKHGLLKYKDEEGFYDR